jgi:glycosyltransferase involved in cell wall biosynthesis
MNKKNNFNVKQLKTCFISSFPPRDCGIASFTDDLSSAMDKRFNPKLKSQVIALNENEKGYDYSDKVIFEMSAHDIEHYIETAKLLNNNDNVKIVSIQHEFGLFGGDYGCYMIPFLETLKKPSIITFHTVLPNPDPIRKKIVRAIANRVSAIIVIANKAIDILSKDYGIEKEKIHLIHHGIPNVPFEDNSKYKKFFGLQNNIVIVNHGFISRGKGIDYAVRSMPPLVKKYPNLIFLIIGETHPKASYENGIAYRKDLEDMILELNLQNNVRLINKYVPLKTLLKYILACDIYLFTNLEKEQISSGVLARAFGCGRAIVSTPIIYAEELLANNRGMLVKFKDPESFSKAVNYLLSNPEIRKEIEKNAYFFSRQMIWENVALSYLKIFNQVVELRKETTEKFSEIKLDHIKKLTDKFGIVQFAQHTIPDKKSGYTLDDNARALITCILHNRIFKDQDSLKLSKIYLKFIEYSQDKKGNFRNNHKNENEYTNPYSEDSFGRAIWSLGYIIKKSRDHNIKLKAKKIIKNSLNYIEKIKSPRANAFVLIGLCYLYKSSRSNFINKLIRKVANNLVDLYKSESSKNWHWFERVLTYSNAQLPNSLFFAYDVTKNKKYLNIAEKTLRFLTDICIIDKKLSPIGQNGWYSRDNKRAFFDQQPIDASSMVQAYLVAYLVTKNSEYYDNAILAFNWFLGNNHLNQMIYDEATGGCFDGLGRHSLNFNQGAESTIAYLMARLFFEEIKGLKSEKP